MFSSPLRVLAEMLYEMRRPQLKSHPCPVNIVCISDTHNTKPDVPDGDVLVHAGDLTNTATIKELQQNLDWLNSLPHTHKFFVPGNHDHMLQTTKTQDLCWGDVVYLQDTMTKVHFSNGRTINFYGSHWTPRYGRWAFQYYPHEDTWTNKHPQQADVFVTHLPPRYHLDVDGYGDENLLRELWRIRPALHVCGHIHGGHGKRMLTYDDFEATYERIRNGNGGASAILKMLYFHLTEVLNPIAAKSFVPMTTLVNGSIVGGPDDELRRAPIKVMI